MGRAQPSLANRLRALVAVVGLVLVGVIVSIGASMADFRDDVSRRDQLIPATADAAQLTGVFVGALDVSGPPGTVAVGTGAFADARQDAFVLLGRLERALIRQPRLAEELGRLRQQTVAWRAGDPEAATRLAARSEHLALSIGAVAERAVSTAATSRTRFITTVTVAAIVAIVLLVVGATLLHRMVVIPLDRFTSDVEDLVDGAEAGELRVESSRELAQVADAVTRMRDRVAAARDRVVRATEAVDQQAPAVAALRTLLEPRRADPPPGLVVAGALTPAQGDLAGDWFDVGRRNGAAVIALGDVCGHGVDAGVLAVRTKFALLDAMTLGLDPAAALDLAARRFARDDTFATAIYAEVDPQAGTCRYASAGHNPALLLRTDGTLEELRRTGPVIGLVDGERPVAEVAVRPGDLLVLYSDGVVEARDDARRQLELEGLEAVVREHAAADPQRIVEAITAAVLAHCGGRCTDDATVVAVRVAG